MILRRSEHKLNVFEFQVIDKKSWSLYIVYKIRTVETVDLLNLISSAK